MSVWPRTRDDCARGWIYAVCSKRMPHGMGRYRIGPYRGEGVHPSNAKKRPALLPASSC